MYQMHQLLRLAPETPFQLTHEQLTEGSDPHIDSRITPIRGIAGVTVSDNRGVDSDTGSGASLQETEGTGCPLDE